MPGMPKFNHGTRIDDSIDIEGYAAVTLAVSAAAAQTALLEEGVYDVWCTVDVFIKVAATANDVTAANGYLIRQNNTVAVYVRDQSRIGAIAGGAGTLSYHKTG
jgi:hypothetical protein